jgi:hypothetical protein
MADETNGAKNSAGARVSCFMIALPVRRLAQGAAAILQLPIPLSHDLLCTGINLGVCIAAWLRAPVDVGP